MTEITRKISLTRALTSMYRLFPDEYQFYPRSWLIPPEHDQFISHFNTKSSANPMGSQQLYIVKPDDGAQGSGIYLIRKPDEIRDPSSKQLVQEYADDPFLLNDRLKFDFRLYAVIKSINPLAIYVAREGMARFCTEKYIAPTAKSLGSLYAHLTNYSLNKDNNSYIHTQSISDQNYGSKRLLSTVFHQMKLLGVKTDQLWHQMKLIIVKTIIAMVPEIMLSYEHCFHDTVGPKCFQIMGFDILVTKDLKPLLLEVNSSPSLTIEHCLPSFDIDSNGNFEHPRVRSIIDELIKIPLIMNTILLVLDLLDTDRRVTSSGTNTRTETSSNGDLDSRDGSGGDVDEDGDLVGSGKSRKQNLIEIFPCRYGSQAYLLLLDKAVYLFLQFINIKQTTQMTISSARTFIKKCQLTDVITDSIEEDFLKIYKTYDCGDYVPYVSGLPFHGFLALLYSIAQKKFTYTTSLLGQVQQLLEFCCTSLRRYGVRSSRLRRAQIDKNNERSSLEIYLLPARVHDTRVCNAAARMKAEMAPPNIRPRHAKSLPRTLRKIYGRKVGQKSEPLTLRNELILPRIR